MIVIEGLFVPLLVVSYALYHHNGRTGLLMEFKGDDQITII